MKTSKGHRDTTVKVVLFVLFCLALASILDLVTDGLLFVRDYSN